MIFDACAWVALSLLGDLNSPAAKSQYLRVGRGVAAQSSPRISSSMRARPSSARWRTSRPHRVSFGPCSGPRASPSSGSTRTTSVPPWSCSSVIETSDGASRTARASSSCGTSGRRRRSPSTGISRRPDSLDCREMRETSARRSRGRLAEFLTKSLARRGGS